MRISFVAYSREALKTDPLWLSNPPGKPLERPSLSEMAKSSDGSEEYDSREQKAPKKKQMCDNILGGVTAESPSPAPRGSSCGILCTQEWPRGGRESL